MFGAFGYGQIAYASLAGPTLFIDSRTETANFTEAYVTALSTSATLLESLAITETYAPINTIPVSWSDAITVTTTQTVIGALVASLNETANVIEVVINGQVRTETFNISDAYSTVSSYNINLTEASTIVDINNVASFYNISRDETSNFTESYVALKYWAAAVDEPITLSDEYRITQTYGVLMQENVIVSESLATEGWFSINSNSPTTWIDINNS